jgi:tyrosinase
MATVGFGAAALAGSRLRGQPPAGLRVRQNALALSPSDPVFQKYAQAVQAMHQLPPTDRRSWRLQAEIHPNHCAHGTPGFLPWHRHYINEFEKICGRLINDPAFALPYWDWTKDGGKIPDAFFDINELNVTFWNDSGVGDFPANWGQVDTRGVRALDKGARAQDDPIRGGNFTVTRINQIKNSATYGLLRSQLEGSPHNSGHVVVGLVAMPPFGHMVDGLSPLDPLFWLHHCNVDRIWAEWQLAGNSTPTFNENYDGQFVDADGNPINVTADASINFESLGFSYDTINVVGPPIEMLRLTGVQPETVFSATSAAVPELQTVSSAPVAEPLALNTPVSVPLTPGRLAATLSETQQVRNAILPTAAVLKSYKGDPQTAVSDYGRPRTIRKRVYVYVERARRTSRTPPVVNVYLNCPYLTPQTPYTDQHYAGSFAFFGHGGAHDHQAGQNFVVDVTDTMERLGLAHRERIAVQLLPVVPEGAGVEGTVQAQAIRIVSL